MMLSQCSLSSESATVRRPIWAYIPWIFFTLNVVSTFGGYTRDGFLLEDPHLASQRETAMILICYHVYSNIDKAVVKNTYTKMGKIK